MGVRADELTPDFLKALKAAHRDKDIKIVVSNLVDETEHLLGTEALTVREIGKVTTIP